MNLIVRFQLIIVLILLATACSQVKSYFPDKEKDYQLSTEISPLQIPQDLQHHAVKNAPMVSEPIYRPQPVQQTQSVIKDTEQIEPAPSFIPVELVDYDGGATRLRIEEPVARAWRFVGKALSHHAIEIVSRDEASFLYVVQYDPDAKKVEDGSIWDEVIFLFGDDPAQEQAYKVRLAEKNAQMTEVIILDSADKPLSKGDALSLLKLLKNSINKDLANRKK
jgi:outer membrane protein assembly factor BamC